MKKIVEIKVSLDNKEAVKHLNMVMHQTIEGMRDETDEENLEALGKIAGSLHMAIDALKQEPRLSKPAFTVIDHVLAVHEGKFTTFCDGKHQQITTKQINAELDKLYNYYYKKGAESGEGIE